MPSAPAAVTALMSPSSVTVKDAAATVPKLTRQKSRSKAADGLRSLVRSLDGWRRFTRSGGG
jgi:hypothetical protein